MVTRPLHLLHITHLRPGHPEVMAVETREVRGVDITRGRRHQLEGAIAAQRHQEHGVVLMTMGNPDTLPLVHSGLMVEHLSHILRWEIEILLCSFFIAREKMS